MVVQEKRCHLCDTALLHVPFLLQPSQPYSDIYSRETLGYTRVSRPPTAFVTLPIVITHVARCDPTREATASRVFQDKSNPRFLAWTTRRTLLDLFCRTSKILCMLEKCLHQRLTCARPQCGYAVFVSTSSINSYFQILLEIRAVYREIQRRQQLDGVIQNSRRTASRYHSNGAW